MKFDSGSARSRKKNRNTQHLLSVSGDIFCAGEEGDSFILGGWIHLDCRAFGVYKAYLSV